MKVLAVEVRWRCKRCRAYGSVFAASVKKAKRRLALEKAEHRGRDHG